MDVETPFTRHIEGLDAHMREVLSTWRVQPTRAGARLLTELRSDPKDRADTIKDIVDSYPGKSRCTTSDRNDLHWSVAASMDLLAATAKRATTTADLEPWQVPKYIADQAKGSKPLVPGHTRPLPLTNGGTSRRPK